MLIRTLLIASLAACTANAAESTEVTPKGPGQLRIEMRDTELVGLNVIYGTQKERIMDGVFNNTPYATFEVAVVPEVAPKLEIEFESPCGTKRIPVTVTASDKRPDRLVVMVAANDKPPTRTSVWTNAANDTPIKIGKATVYNRTIYDFGCAASHELSIGGTSAGTVETGLGKDDRLFVAAKPGECFKYATVTYGRTEERPSETIWQGKRVYRFDRTIDLFLKDADEKVMLRRGVAGKVETQIQKIGCPGSWDAQ